MKALKCGTHAEQKRFAQGWLTATQRPQCGNCSNAQHNIKNPDSLSESVSYSCTIGDFATSKSAICNRYEATSRD